MKKLISLITMVSLAGMMVAGMAQADDDVTATVTVQNVGVSLDQTTFNYGVMNNNSVSSTVLLWAGAGITATSTGNVTEDFDINGADTVGWTLDTTTTTADHYVHKFCNDTDNVCSAPPANYTNLPTTPSTEILKNGVTLGTAVAFQLEIITPNPSTVFTQQSAVVTVLASAS